MASTDEFVLLARPVAALCSSVWSAAVKPSMVATRPVGPGPVFVRLPRSVAIDALRLVIAAVIALSKALSPSTDGPVLVTVSRKAATAFR